MKSVLISIQPKWCELIASGKKTVEVRKTIPKLETPFRCYIYETRAKCDRPIMLDFGVLDFHGRGQVIGEFVCDKVLDICIEMSKPDDLKGYPFPCTCLTDKDIMQYLGNGKTGYGWHISDLVIYDKPKDLDYFRKPIDCHRGKDRENCKVCWDCEIKRPPQSWCYVEGE